MAIVKSKLLKKLSEAYPNFLKLGVTGQNNFNTGANFFYQVEGTNNTSSRIHIDAEL